MEKMIRHRNSSLRLHCRSPFLKRFAHVHHSTADATFVSASSRCGWARSSARLVVCSSTPEQPGAAPHNPSNKPSEADIQQGTQQTQQAMQELKQRKAAVLQLAAAVRQREVALAAEVAAAKHRQAALEAELASLKQQLLVEERNKSARVACLAHQAIADADQRHANQVASLSALHAEQLAALHTAAEGAQHELVGLTAQLHRAKDQLAESERREAGLSSEHAGTVQQLTESRLALTHLKDQLLTAEQRLAESELREARLSSEHAGTVQQLTEHRQAFANLEDQLLTAEQRLAESERREAGLSSEHAGTVQQLTESRQALAHLKDQLLTAEQRLAESVRREAGLSSEHAETVQQLTESRRALAHLEDQLLTAKHRLAESERRDAGLSSEHAGTVQQLTESRQAIAHLKGQLLTAEQRLAESERQQTSLLTELKSAEQRLAKLEVHRDGMIAVHASTMAELEAKLLFAEQRLAESDHRQSTERAAAEQQLAQAQQAVTDLKAQLARRSVQAQPSATVMDMEPKTISAPPGNSHHRAGKRAPRAQQDTSQASTDEHEAISPAAYQRELSEEEQANVVGEVYPEVEEVYQGYHEGHSVDPVEALMGGGPSAASGPLMAPGAKVVTRRDRRRSARVEDLPTSSIIPIVEEAAADIPSGRGRSKKSAAAAAEVPAADVSDDAAAAAVGVQATAPRKGGRRPTTPSTSSVQRARQGGRRRTPVAAPAETRGAPMLPLADTTAPSSFVPEQGGVEVAGSKPRRGSLHIGQPADAFIISKSARWGKSNQTAAAIPADLMAAPSHASATRSIAASATVRTPSSDAARDALPDIPAGLLLGQREVNPDGSSELVSGDAKSAADDLREITAQLNAEAEPGLLEGSTSTAASPSVTGSPVAARPGLPELAAAIAQAAQAIPYANDSNLEAAPANRDAPKPRPRSRQQASEAQLASSLTEPQLDTASDLLASAFMGLHSVQVRRVGDLSAAIAAAAVAAAGMQRHPEPADAQAGAKSVPAMLPAAVQPIAGVSQAASSLSSEEIEAAAAGILSSITTVSGTGRGSMLRARSS